MHKKFFDTIGAHLAMLKVKLVPVLNNDELEKAEAKLKAAQSMKVKDDDYIEFLTEKRDRIKAINEDSTSPFVQHRASLGSIYSQMMALHESMGEIGYYTNSSKRGRQPGMKVAKPAGQKRAYKRKPK